MSSTEDYSRKKRTTAADYERLLGKKLSALQRRVYYSILPIVLDLDVQDSRIAFNVSNINQIKVARRAIDNFIGQEGGRIATWIANRMKNLLKFNKFYYKTFIDESLEKIEDTVTKKTMLRLGYDVSENVLIPNGYLDDIFRNSPIGQQVASEMSRSMAGGMGLKEFQSSFKDAFISESGSGIAERHFKRATFDLFQQYDRQISKEYADELELNYARYSGTIKDTTRSFCKERVGKVFSREEIKKWKDLEFQGKPKNYVPEIDLGGYNCRHSLDWISDELAERWRNE